ncbi:MAG TPA: 5'-3' exonuclease H3TH domain-containing protein [Actinomycetota bacterium]|nr:5'-3' exonuclease H3TH domain-containing protein [Actinomycetota bacterium]
MTLLLLDSASLYFRAFYGVKAPMPAPDGTPTNAVRGFLDMVSTLVTRLRPSDMVACLDQDWRPAWRVALLPTYKTHRLADQNITPAGGGAPPGEAEPPGLAEQVPVILDALAALGIAALGAPEHEADDVIATLAEQATMPVDVVSGDRDLFQLVDDARAVRVLYTARGVRQLEVVDAAAVKARYGIEPAQYADFATLRGDPSDGLPGVPGIGAKTAAGLLTRFGTLDALLEAAAARDRRLAGVAGKLSAAGDYLTRAPAVVRTVRTLSLPAVDTALPRGPADAGKLVELEARWGIGNVLGRATKALRLQVNGG